MKDEPNLSRSCSQDNESLMDVAWAVEQLVPTTELGATRHARCAILRCASSHQSGESQTQSLQ